MNPLYAHGTTTVDYGYLDWGTNPLRNSALLSLGITLPFAAHESGGGGGGGGRWRSMTAWRLAPLVAVAAAPHALPRPQNRKAAPWISSRHERSSRGSSMRPRSAAAAMAAVFAAAGDETVMSESPIPGGGPLLRGTYPAEGVDEEGLGIEFGVSANASTLNGMTRCTAGDSSQINEERRQPDR